MTDQAENRREFFRINDRIALQYRPLETQDEKTLKRLHHERCAECDRANEVPEEELKRPSSMSLVGRRYPEILAYVKALEKMVAANPPVAAGSNFGDTPVLRQLVNISGGGIRFTTPEKLDPGTLVELILRMENGLRFVAFAEIVRIAEDTLENGETGWNIAARFTHIRDDDQNELIRFLLSRQMENVRVASI